MINCLHYDIIAHSGNIHKVRRQVWGEGDSGWVWSKTYIYCFSDATLLINSVKWGRGEVKYLAKYYAPSRNSTDSWIQFIIKLSSHLTKNWFIYFIESPWKMMKNAFYFVLKAPFVLKIFKFLWLFGHAGKTAWLGG